jgi:oligopeptide/dipeptide ABC transporter ATP-binding protein
VTFVLEVDDLAVRYGPKLAVDDVDLRVEPGQVYALIGETGSGKTSVANAVARLLPPTANLMGRVLVDGLAIDGMSADALRRIRGTKVGYIPQDAIASLNPVVPIGRQIAEMFEVHFSMPRTEAERRAVEELGRLWISDPESVAHLYPHQLSGGMRQRVMIAIAVALRPPLLIADEPTTALDVSTQAEILRLVGHLREELGVAVLWITHDMGVVAELADRVGVMYAGRLVEEGSALDVFDHPKHPYTHGLLRTLHSLRSGDPGSLLYQIEGQPPASATAVPGCPFHPRCPSAGADCRQILPQLIDNGGRRLACHHPVETQGLAP